MKVLIAVASRHGSTQEIAEVLAEELRSQGCTAVVRSAGQVFGVTGYDAAVVGSAVYMGKWLPDARQFVDLHQKWLATVPVWLFSSGPLGAPNPRPTEGPVDLPPLLAATGARGHQLFVGKLDKQRLSRGERLVVKMVKAPEGDFRDWQAIRNWAHEIRAALPTRETAAN